VAAQAQSTRREPCVIASVTDGDSLRCTDQRRVRLLLLDAPEMNQVPFGQRSRDALRRRLRRGDTAWMEFDVQREDRYGRTLAHVWTASAGGTHVNLAHARDGWAVAVVFPPNVRHLDAVRRAVAEARTAKRGLWADGAFSCEPIAHKRGDC
jgi:endonuclease YncB( thermonuclease family)